MPTYKQVWPIYAKQWDEMKIKPNRLGEVNEFAQRALKNKSRYQAIEKSTGVPWYLIAIAHERESGGRFDRQFAQGWPLTSKSKWEPYIGPFKTFEDSAVAGLKIDGLDKVIDWRLEKILYYLTSFNGWGYWNYHNKMPSPYVWGATNQQVRGKYVADGKFDPNVMDMQLGCAAMLRGLMNLDKTINPQRED